MDGRLPAAFLPLLLLSAPMVSAQTDVVIPSIGAITEGNDLSAFPFGLTSFRSQQVWAGGAFCQTSAVLNAIAFRPDNDNSIGSQAATIPALWVTVSHTSVAPPTMSTTFASNVTGTPTTVFQGTLSLPAYVSGEGAVAPWGPSIPLNAFAYSVAQGNLLVDMWGIDVVPLNTGWVTDCALPGGQVRTLGSTGQTSRFDRLQYLVAANGSGNQGRFSGLVPGDSVIVFAQASAFAYSGLHLFGFNKLVPPFDLSGLGAPTNAAYILPSISFPFTMSGTIRFQAPVTLAIPRVSGLVGFQLYGQAVVVDSAANNLGLVTTNGVELTVGQPGEHPSQQLNARESGAASGTFRYTGGILGGPVVRLSGVFN